MKTGSLCVVRRAGLGLLATIAGCVAYAATGPAPVVASLLEDTSWTLTETAGQRTLAGSNATLSFREGRVQGSDGCNHYSGPYALSGSTLRIGPNLASTMMACPQEIMEQAGAFMKALVDARSFLIRDGELQLLSADGKPLARLKGQQAVRTTDTALRALLADEWAARMHVGWLP